ncbi:MFS transporter [Alicyclobacillus curvatus]|nr:MFS transporter [Alicyclobacillus curvatus]
MPEPRTLTDTHITTDTHISPSANPGADANTNITTAISTNTATNITTDITAGTAANISTDISTRTAVNTNTALQSGVPHTALLLSLNRGLSALGGQIAITVLPITVFLVTHSIAIAGTVLGTRLLVSTLFTPISGLFADRWNPKYLMMISLGTRIILFAAMAETRSIALLAALAALTAAGGMMESTAVSALTPKLIDEASLPRANALISSAQNLSFIIGPLLGGILIAKTSPAWGFYAAAATQMLALLSLLYLPLRMKVHPQKSEDSLLRQLLGGIQYAFSDKFMFIMLTSYSVFIFGLTAFNVLAVGLAFHFGKGSTGYGVLIAAQAVGMLAVTFASTRLLKTSTLLPLFYTNMPVQGLAIIGVALSPSYTFAAFFALIQGIGWGMEQASVTTVLQQNIPGNLQGRVFGLFFSALAIAETLGVTIFGWLGQFLGDSGGLLIAGSLSTLCALLSIILLRPILSSKSVPCNIQ